MGHGAAALFWRAASVLLVLLLLLHKLSKQCTQRAGVTGKTCAQRAGGSILKERQYQTQESRTSCELWWDSGMRSLVIGAAGVAAGAAVTYLVYRRLQPSGITVRIESDKQALGEAATADCCRGASNSSRRS